MTKLEKAIKGLECCTTIGEVGFPICDKCPYFEYGSCPNLDEMHTDALELLKEQEKVIENQRQTVYRTERAFRNINAKYLSLLDRLEQEGDSE